ncbi:hypothetical protein EVAR_15966_1 [Eumeta japonica]|uniref:Uncharacterized protein n=1 Tax=Eumeta variegata TaxID=151549 RepID=A0A4C1UL41_EUMVA|nr:hypothetical protein EVAR_15966_1 [Eumeta japonica]
MKTDGNNVNDRSFYGKTCRVLKARAGRSDRVFKVKAEPRVISQNDMREFTGTVNTASCYIVFGPVEGLRRRSDSSTATTTEPSRVVIRQRFVSSIPVSQLQQAIYRHEVAESVPSSKFPRTLETVGVRMSRIKPSIVCANCTPSSRRPALRIRSAAN